MKFTAFTALAIHSQLKRPVADGGPVSENDAVVHLDDDQYLHIPVYRHDFYSKEQFVEWVSRQAGDLYDTLEKVVK